VETRANAKRIVRLRKKMKVRSGDLTTALLGELSLSLGHAEDVLTDYSVEFARIVNLLGSEQAHSRFHKLTKAEKILLIMALRVGRGEDFNVGDYL